MFSIFSVMISGKDGNKMIENKIKAKELFEGYKIRLNMLISPELGHSSHLNPEKETIKSYKFIFK
uniref:Uncharacterized protein n=1 Tax=candidate division WOR-3 bacterium TaxID=2052148 RepID=A0A7C4UGG2_UNCW3